WTAPGALASTPTPGWSWNGEAARRSVTTGRPRRPRWRPRPLHPPKPAASLAPLPNPTSRACRSSETGRERGRC
ncbi:MAG: hypothetical protein AVDCRST_MAG04-3387, partial [uncultured Acetobacteraceae bacterium]